MTLTLPSDISAETILNYIPRSGRTVELKGSHKRNAYEDVLDIREEEGKWRIELARESLYDILPEALFHPIDRYDNIPANEYRERFAEEYEQQQAEEAGARRFLAPFDTFLLGMSCQVDRLKNDLYAGNSVISGIICDALPPEYRDNRFVSRLIPFTPACRRIRGDRDLLTVILRKILRDEGIEMSQACNTHDFTDSTPRYDCTLDPESGEAEDMYLGCGYAEQVTEYEVSYWNDDECDGAFLSFIAEMQVFENFINDWFVSVEASVKFSISTLTLPPRLSDELYYNYLGYNTNL